MITTRYACKNWLKFPVFIVCLTLALALVQPPAIHAAGICKEGLQDLQSSQAVLQDKGGIWGYLEKSSNMKDNSTLGLQIDGKLQRLIVSFEDLCAQGKTPTQKLFNLISGLTGDARMLFNRDADRQPRDKVLKTLQDLAKNIDDLLAQLPN